MKIFKGKKPTIEVFIKSVSAEEFLQSFSEHYPTWRHKFLQSLQSIPRQTYPVSEAQEKDQLN
jgi:hypothetical protein